MDNERPIERLLRRYAAKRGEDAGAPFELPTFARRRLQIEVVRRASRSRQNRETGVWYGVRRFLIYGGCALGLVGIYLLVLRQSWNWSKTDTADSSADSAEMAKAKLPDLPSDSLSGITASGPLGSPSAAVTPDSLPAPADAVTKSTVPTLTAEGGAVYAGKSALQEAVEPEPELFPAAAPASAVVASAAPAARADVDAFADKSNSNSARFENSTPGQQPERLARTATTPVLNQFRMEQAGDQLRVVDADGSTYSGPVQPAADVPATLGVDQVKLRDTTAEPKVVRYSFVVTGTNLTLNQPIVFKGTLVSESNSVATETRQLLSKPTDRGYLSFPSLKNASVNGKAEVGNGKEVDVISRPASP